LPCPVISHYRITTWGYKINNTLPLRPKVDKKFCRQEGKSNSRRLTTGSSSQQFEDSRARKEGYSRQIQGLKQFQDSADRTRKKTQGGIQGAQQPRQKAKQKPVVHSDQAIEGGQIQLTILFYSIIFIV
jgi:hypothetical protein